MPKRTIFNKNSRALQNKNTKNINRDIFNCLLNDRSQKPLSQKDIATKIKCSPSTVSRHIPSLLNDKRLSGSQYYYIKWTFNGYIMARENVDEIEYNEINQNNYREELVYDLAQAKACTMSDISIITSTVVFCGVTPKFVNAFESAFRSIFSKECYHTVVCVKDGVYIILNEVAKKELVKNQNEIAKFYKDIVKEIENSKHLKTLSPTKIIEKSIK